MVYVYLRSDLYTPFGAVYLSSTPLLQHLEATPLTRDPFIVAGANHHLALSIREPLSMFLLRRRRTLQDGQRSPDAEVGGKSYHDDHRITGPLSSYEDNGTAIFPIKRQTNVPHTQQTLPVLSETPCSEITLDWLQKSSIAEVTTQIFSHATLRSTPATITLDPSYDPTALATLTWSRWP